MDISFENWTRSLTIYIFSCRDAEKIDKTRLRTSTRNRRVAEACQSSLHKPSSLAYESPQTCLPLHLLTAMAYPVASSRPRQCGLSFPVLEPV